MPSVTSHIVGCNVRQARQVRLTYEQFREWSSFCPMKRTRDGVLSVPAKGSEQILDETEITWFKAPPCLRYYFVGPKQKRVPFDQN